jgi:cobalt-zinc-cadmium efflux system membrane fusion protein
MRRLANRRLTGILGLAAVLALLWLGGCTPDSGESAPAQASAADGHAHLENDGHAHLENDGSAAEGHDDTAAAPDHDGPATEGHEGHGHGEDPLAMSIAEIEAARCEHGIPTYECDECRYEVGVVKVAPSVLKIPAKPDHGLIGTGVVELRTVASGLNVTGEISLNENAAVHISPRVPGIIESVPVDIGGRVRQGDVLLRIVSAELGRTLADYERSRAQTELARQNFERERGLFEQKIASEQDMITARMAFEEYKTELQAAERALRVLGLTDAELRDLGDGATISPGIGSLSIRAPQDGVVIQKHAVVGELVEPGHDVMLLADLGTVWVWADVYERDLPLLLDASAAGAPPARVRVRAFPDETFEAVVDYVGATMEERTRTIKVRATVQNHEGRLRPGMFCEVRIAIGGGQERLVVPRAALLSDEGRDFVFTHWKEDYYLQRAVRKGDEFDDQVEILAGLEPGQTIVTEGAFLLKSDVLREKMGAGCAD